MKKRFQWILRPLFFGAGFAIMFFILAMLFHMWTGFVIAATQARCPDVKPEYQTTLPLGAAKAISLENLTFGHRDQLTQGMDVLAIQGIHTP